MSVSKNVSSLVLYGGTGTGSTIASVASEVPKLDKIPNGSAVMSNSLEAIAEQTKMRSPWLYDLFPTLVDNGTVVVRDGYIYIGGISASEIVTISLAIFSFGILIVKTIFELKTKSKDK